MIASLAKEKWTRENIMNSKRLHFQWFYGQKNKETKRNAMSTITDMRTIYKIIYMLIVAGLKRQARKIIWIPLLVLVVIDKTVYSSKTQTIFFFYHFFIWFGSVCWATSLCHQKSSTHFQKLPLISHGWYVCTDSTTARKD